jgi:hypothetical protein
MVSAVRMPRLASTPVSARYWPSDGKRRAAVTAPTADAMIRRPMKRLTAVSEW